MDTDIIIVKNVLSVLLNSKRYFSLCLYHSRCLPEEAISAVAYGTGRPPDPLGQDDLKLNVRLQNPPPHTQSVPLSAHDMFCSVAQPRMNYDPLPQYKHT